MKNKIWVVLTSYLSLMVLVLFGQNCSVQTKLEGVESLSSAHGACATPKGLSGSPKTIEDVVDIINALPKPTSVACFLETLDRPLKVSLTNSVSSAQPAEGSRSPRIFIAINNLSISVVPDGQGSEAVELGLKDGPNSSIKAEIPFPVIENIPVGAPYSRINLDAGTACVFCHKGERQVTEITSARAFSSDILRPSWTKYVSLTSLKEEYTKCDFAAEPERCEFLKAFFSHGKVVEQDYPF